MGKVMSLWLPPIPAFPEYHLRAGTIFQIVRADGETLCDVYPFSKSGFDGWEAKTGEKDNILLTPTKKGDFPVGFDKILHIEANGKTISGNEKLAWIKHPAYASLQPEPDFVREVERARGARGRTSFVDKRRIPKRSFRACERRK